MSDFHDIDETPVEREEQTVITRQPGYASTEQITHDVGTERRQAGYQINRILWMLLSILEGILVIRFVLKMIAANPGNAFADFMYRITDPFVAPFASLVGNPSFGGVVLEITTLIAMLVYALAFGILVRLITILFDRPSSRTVMRTTQEQLPNTGEERVTRITRKD